MSFSDVSSVISSLPVSRRSSILLTSLSSLLSSAASSVDDGSMSLPPEGHFETLDALEQHAQTHAQNHGYAIITIRWKKRYKTKGSTFRKYTMGCHCTTKYRDRMKRPRRRQQSTLKTDCQFSFHALQDADGFTLKHRDGV